MTPDVPGAPAPPRRILVADDEKTILGAIALFLRRRGHDVQTATDAGSALELIEARGFDIAFVDARMPGDGLTVIRRLEGDERFAGTVVLMTGALPTDPNVEVGPDVIRMQKPFRLSELIPVVEGGANG